MPHPPPFTHFIKDGVLLPIDHAVLPVTQLEVTYGFGVYETVRVVHGKAWFLTQHTERFFHSAEIIGLVHNQTEATVNTAIGSLISVLNADTCNLKLLLIGGLANQSATFFVTASAPIFIDKRWYKTGVTVTTETYERFLPQAKTLSMLGSYLAYRKAKELHCYDCLLIDRSGMITEGTRTNVYALRGREIISAPEENILPGIMRSLVLLYAKRNGYSLHYERMTKDTIRTYDALLLSSTSSKLLPIRSIDGEDIGISEDALLLVKGFVDFLAQTNGVKIFS